LEVAVRFLVDECTGPIVARWLSTQGHEVLSIYDEARGLDDEAILIRACAEDRVIVTNDKDFGDLVFRKQMPHRGVILLRLTNPNPADQIAALDRFLASGTDIAGGFVVVSEASIRVAGGPGEAP
jgi:predicted nuclease of predicted toxin-antitoxin system